MNPATVVTASRIALSPLFFILFTTTSRAGAANWVAAAGLWLLFAIIEVSDFVDGWVARKSGKVTDLGKVFDPFADSFARLTYFLSYTVAGLMPPWVFLLVLYRDLGVSFIRLLAMGKGVAMPAQLSGKIKAWVYAIAGGLGLAQWTVDSLGLPGLAGIAGIAAQSSFVLVAAIAVWTFLDYSMSYRRMPGKARP